MTQPGKTCHEPWQSGFHPWVQKTKKDFWKLSFDQWHVHTTNTPCLQQIDLINKKDYIVHWLSYSCLHLMTQTILGLYLISSGLAFDCAFVSHGTAPYGADLLDLTFFFFLIPHPHPPLCYLCLTTFLWHISDKVVNLFCRVELW